MKINKNFVEEIIMVHKMCYLNDGLTTDVIQSFIKKRFQI